MIILCAKKNYQNNKGRPKNRNKIKMKKRKMAEPGREMYVFIKNKDPC